MRTLLLSALLVLGTALPAFAQNGSGHGQGNWKQVPNACESGVVPAVLTDHGVSTEKASCPIETARSYPRDFPPANGTQANAHRG